MSAPPRKWDPWVVLIVVLVLLAIALTVELPS